MAQTNAQRAAAEKAKAKAAEAKAHREKSENEGHSPAEIQAAKEKADEAQKEADRLQAEADAIDEPVTDQERKEARQKADAEANKAAAAQGKGVTVHLTADQLGAAEKEPAKKGEVHKYQLISGIHQDATGIHTPTENQFIESDKDLVKLHGDDRFVRLS